MSSASMKSPVKELCSNRRTGPHPYPRTQPPHALLLKLRPESDKTAGNFPLSLRRQRDTLREDVDERPQRRDELRRGGRGGGVAGLQRQQHCERVLRAVLLVEGAYKSYAY